ncbi:high mobility group box domain-containing protein, partial [Vararia minispora EC-137]
PGYIKRPRNSFIIFRCDYVQRHRGTSPPTGEKYMRLSKRASEAWRKLNRQERAVYVRLSELEKEEHARQHPDYVYRPNKKRR